MKIKNITGLFQYARKGDNKYIARPWRTIDIPEGCEFKEDVFEIIIEKKQSELKNKNKGE